MVFKSISSVAHLHLSRLLPRRPIQVRPIRAVGSDGSEDLAAALCPKYVVSVEYEVKALAIEHARAHTVPKPWGIVDLRPWSNACPDGSAIGEIRYERPVARLQILRYCSSCCSRASRRVAGSGHAPVRLVPGRK